MLSVADVEKDFEAVVTSTQRLKAQFPQWQGWPAGLTLEKNWEDLKRHQEDFENRREFTYTVIRLDESAVLGCLYIYPSQLQGVDAEVVMWVRDSEYEKGLDLILFQTVKAWIDRQWPFEAVVYPDRELPRSRYI